MQHGIQYIDRGEYMKGKPGTEEESKQVIDMYKRGYTTREIAARLNRSYCFVYTRIDNYRIDNMK